MKEQFLIKNEACKQEFTVRQKGYFYKLDFLEQYLYGHNGYIAGGCFKDIFLGKEVKDIDIFFRDQNDFNDALRYYNHVNWELVYENQNAISFKNPENGVRIELIKRVFGTPEYILSQFDFSICKFAYIKINDDFSGISFGGVSGQNLISIYCNSYFEDITQRKLSFDNSIVNPVQTFDRLLRYLHYGFILDRESKSKLINSIFSLETLNLDDLTDENYF